MIATSAGDLRIAAGQAMPAVMRRLLLLLPVACLFATPAVADQHNYTIGSFERVRVEGPFTVTIAVGKSPGATATGERAVLDNANVRVEGGTLVVSMGVNGWGERGAVAGEAPVIAVTTPGLRSVAVNGGAQVTVSGMKGQALDLSLTGSGTIAADGIAADQLSALVIGTGAMTLSGRANRARLVTNGPGAMEASALAVDALTVRIDGAGETHARARDTAQVTALGVGRVVVEGSPSCTVLPPQNHGPVVCGLVAP